MSTKQEIPRRRRGIRDGRTELGAAKPDPAPVEAPEVPKAAETPKTPGKRPQAPARASGGRTGAPTGERRAQGKVRVRGDIAIDLADRFSKRADEHRFSKATALAGAIELLEQLDDDAYEALLRKHR